jgi:hypothetical protein
MITALKLKENQLDELYDWVDGLPMSRPKKYAYQLKKETSAETSQMDFSWQRLSTIFTPKSSKSITTLPETLTKLNSAIGKPSKVTFKPLLRQTLLQIGNSFN